MNPIFTKALPLLFLLLGGFSNYQSDNVELVCVRKQMAANTCHFNFTKDGAKYRYQDVGCRFKTKTEVLEKVKEGSLGLARDWKIECAETSSVVRKPRYEYN